LDESANVGFSASIVKSTQIPAKKSGYGRVAYPNSEPFPTPNIHDMFQSCRMLLPFISLPPRVAIADRVRPILLPLRARRIWGFSVNFLRFLRFF
jgi:hypothetical protein